MEELNSLWTWYMHAPVKITLVVVFLIGLAYALFNIFYMGIVIGTPFLFKSLKQGAKWLYKYRYAFLYFSLVILFLPIVFLGMISLLGVFLMLLLKTSGEKNAVKASVVCIAFNAGYLTFEWARSLCDFDSFRLEEEDEKVLSEFLNDNVRDYDSKIL